MSDNHEEQLKKAVHEKMEQLSLAHYSGDIKCFAAVIINKNGDTQLFQGFDSHNLGKIYLGCGIIRRKIEDQIISGEMPLKDRD